MLDLRIPILSNVKGASLPRVLERVSAIIACVKKRNTNHSFSRVMLTPEWNLKTSVLKNKSRSYL